jgi:chromosome segregation ATPase
LKVASLTEAEKGQVELRKALADKEAELVAAHKEFSEERRRSADTNHLRGKLRTAEADIRSLQRRHGILRTNLEEAHAKEKQMTRAFEVMKMDMDQLREHWEQVQSQLVAEVERTNEENTGLKQAMTNQNAELDKVRKERDAVVRRHLPLFGFRQRRNLLLQHLLAVRESLFPCCDLRLGRCRCLGFILSAPGPDPFHSHSYEG